MDDRKKQWADALEKLGPVNVRARLNGGGIGHGDGAAVDFAAAEVEDMGSVRRIPADRGFVEQWLAGKEAEAARRGNLQHRLLWVATIASVVGALLALWSALYG